MGEPVDRPTDSEPLFGLGHLHELLGLLDNSKYGDYRLEGLFNDGGELGELDLIDIVLQLKLDKLGESITRLSCRV